MSSGFGERVGFDMNCLCLPQRAVDRYHLSRYGTGEGGARASKVRGISPLLRGHQRVESGP